MSASERTLTTARLRVLVVDDSVAFGKAVVHALSALPFVEVVGTAVDGVIALEKTAQLRPDVLTLDVEMPQLDGIGALKRLRAEHPSVDVVMVSALTRSGAEVTLQALELGAVDFITKEAGGTAQENGEKLRGQLERILSMLHHRRAFEARLQRRHGAAAAPAPSAALRLRLVTRSPLEAVAIAVSTGGPRALNVLLPGLPADLSVPVFIVQHMPPTFTRTLAAALDAKAALKVVEAENGDLPKPGTVYIAPGGRQMKVEGDAGGGRVLRITDDPPEKHCKPSADYLFRSVARCYEARALGVILTGMGDDGVLGLGVMKRHRAPVLAQDESSSVVFGMPGAAIQAGVVDLVLPLEQIAAEISRLCAAKRRG